MANNVDKVRDLYFDLLDTWNRRDAAGMAALYAAEGSQVGFDGSTANGPDEIEGHLRPIFTDHPTARFVGKVRDVRLLAKDVALLRAVAGMVPPGKDQIMPERNTIQTLIASRAHSGEWKVEMFHNTPAAFDGRPEEARRLTKELQMELDSATAPA